MNELELKYGCNPNQKPSRIFMKDGGDLPLTVLNGKPGYINFLDALNSWQLARELKQAVHTARPCDLWEGEEFVRRNMLIHNVVYNASMAVFRKSAIPSDERYTQFRMNGDWLFWCEVARRGRVAISTAG